MTAARPTKPFVDAAAWEKWLAENHASSTGLWLKLAKKASGAPSVTYAEALDVALCWGWIDGQKDAVDDKWWVQRFGPRTPRSGWSKINCDKAEKLMAQGLMQPTGLKEIERAKADGRWAAAYDSPKNAVASPELVAALKKNAKAAKAFEALDSRNRFAILYRVQTAKKAETKAARIAAFVEMLAKGELLYPARKKAGG